MHFGLILGTLQCPDYHHNLLYFSGIAQVWMNLDKFYGHKSKNSGKIGDLYNILVGPKFF
jgi:hypothetical protein